MLLFTGTVLCHDEFSIVLRLKSLDLVCMKQLDTKVHIFLAYINGIIRYRLNIQAYPYIIFDKKSPNRSI